MYYVYILKSKKDQKYYIGHTRDIGKRILQHNCGNVTSTQNRRPMEVVYSKNYETRGESIVREKYIKSLKGGNAFQKLIQWKS